jgi:hypothetical protein
VKITAAPVKSSEAPSTSIDPLRIQHQAERLQSALDRLKSEERKALEQDYVTELEQSHGFEIHLILGLYRKSGMNSPIVESHFRTFARARLVRELDESEFPAAAFRQSAERLCEN